MDVDLTGNHAYLMDCMDLMAAVPDQYFDLAVVDPPYGIGIGNVPHIGGDVLATHHPYHTFDDQSPPSAEYFRELMRVSKNQIIWGANHFVDRLPHPASSCWLVWDKQNGANSFADCELAWTSFRSAVRIFRYRWQGMLQGNMRDKELRIHPTQKPIALYRWIFGRFASPCDRVLDTHLGGGSSRIAAYEAHLPFIGCERDAEFYRLEEERFAAYSAQQSIF